MRPTLLIEADEAVRTAVRLRHRHVLVDEYQDVNRASARLLLVVAPKLRAKPAPKIVDFLFGRDCLSPAEAARKAPITGRAARRLFDRLVALGAARELSARPAFRLYGL